MNKYETIEAKFTATSDFLYGRLGQVQAGDTLQSLTVEEISVLSDLDLIKRQRDDDGDIDHTSNNGSSDA